MSRTQGPWMGSQSPICHDDVLLRPSTPYPPSNLDMGIRSSRLYSDNDVRLEDWLSEEAFAMEEEGADLGLSMDKTNQNSELLLDHQSPEPDFSNFSQWIDGIHRPKIPCVLCRNLKLQCIILRTGEANPNPSDSCAGCVALFRECSFAPGVKRLPADFEILSVSSGHLHGVIEENFGEFLSEPLAIGEKRLETYVPIREARPTSSDMNSEQASKSIKINSRRGYRFDRASRDILQQWYSAHNDDPYPSEAEKSQLVVSTGLSKTQINGWFSNTRRYHQKKGIVFPASNILNQEFNSTGMSPMQRWCNSPPESESLPPGFLNNKPYLQEPKVQRRSYKFDLASADERAQRHARSTSSIDSGDFSHSNSSMSSLWSNGSQRSLKIRRRQKARAKTRLQERTGKSDGPYTCLFCGRSFKKKYDWQRHERSIHLPLESWTCTPDNTGTILDKSLSLLKCAFCCKASPNHEHMKSHNLEACVRRPLIERNFPRKDHFRQHLQKFHSATEPENSIIDSWKVENYNVTSRCGFCGCVTESWNARVDHIAVHYGAGFSLKEWVGDRGFDSVIEESIRDFVPLEVLQFDSSFGSEF